MEIRQVGYGISRYYLGGKVIRVVAEWPFSRPNYKSNYSGATEQELLAYEMLVHLDCKS